MVHWLGRSVGAAVLLLAADVGAEAAPTPAGPCRFHAPADLDARNARWLGACRNAAAEGAGIIRAGAVEPYAFFAGRMRAGRPIDGLLMLRQGDWMVAVRFDAGLHVVSGDGLHPRQDDRLFARAHAAALATAAKYRRAGNRPSADYYTRLARRIVDGRPE